MIWCQLADEQMLMDHQDKLFAERKKGTAVVIALHFLGIGHGGRPRSPTSRATP